MGENVARSESELAGAVMVVLTRLPLQRGQLLVLRMLQSADDEWVSAARLMAEAESRGIGRIQSALSALSRRVGATYELPDDIRGLGMNLLLDVRPGTPNSYRLSRPARLALTQDRDLLRDRAWASENPSGGPS